MNQALKKLIRLYPASWRKRYGAEFEALLEDTHPNWLTMADVVKGALTMQLTTWSFSRLTIACALTGALFAMGIAFTRPQQFRSQAMIKIIPTSFPEGLPGPPEPAFQAIDGVLLEALSRSSLTQVINIFNLYQGERSRMPIEDVLNRMKQRIAVTPVIIKTRLHQEARSRMPMEDFLEGLKPRIQVTPGKSIAGRVVAVAVAFDYPDRTLANHVADNLTGRMIIAANRPDSPVRIDSIDPASFPQKPLGPARASQIGFGLLSGTLSGMLLFAVWGRRRKYTPCPTCGRRMPVTTSPQTAGESAGHP